LSNSADRSTAFQELRLLKRIAWALWLPAVAFLAWELCARFGLLNPLLYPPPSTLLEVSKEMFARGELQRQVAATLTRLSLGFLAGAAAGVCCGILMGTTPGVRRSLELTLSGGYATPKLALLPMFMLLFGVGEPARVFLVAINTFILMAMYGLDAIVNVDRHYVDLASNYGAGRWDVIRHVYLPAITPPIFTGLRISLGTGLTITIALELVSCPDGLGSMIWTGWQAFYTEQLYVGVILAAMIGATLHFSLRWIETRLLPWRS